MSKRKSVYSPSRGQQLVILTVVLAVVVVSLAATFVMLYKPSQQTELPFDTGTGTGTGEPPVDPSNTVDTEGPTVPIYIARDDVYNFLVIGHDRQAMLADVVMLVNYDIGAGKVSIMQIPRDTYINAGSNVPKINVLFAAYYNRAVHDGKKNPAEIAAEQLAVTLEQNLCIQIQYTAVMDLDGFAAIVDAVDGVDVEIPFDMDYEDPEQDLYIHFKAGKTHLDGAAAEEFVRFRSGFLQADIGRVNAQKIFLAAFIDKITSSISISNISLITNLANEVVNNLTTTVTAADVVYFGKNFLSVDLSDMTMLTIPGESVQSGRTWYYVVNRAATRDAVNKYFNIYNNDITDPIFDKNIIFGNAEDAKVHKVYTADSIGDDIYKVDDVIKDSIDIPQVP